MDISPLLRLYYDLSQNTKFKLPSKEMLKLDQTVFTKLVEKLRRAHQTELAYLKHRFKQLTNDFLKREVDRVQRAAVSEVKMLIRKFESVKEEATKYSEMNDKLNEMLVRSEKRVSLL